MLALRRVRAFSSLTRTLQAEHQPMTKSDTADSASDQEGFIADQQQTKPKANVISFTKVARKDQKKSAPAPAISLPPRQTRHPVATGSSRDHLPAKAFPHLTDAQRKLIVGWEQVQALAQQLKTSLPADSKLDLTKFDGERIAVVGRVSKVHRMSKLLVFYDIVRESKSMQLIALGKWYHNPDPENANFIDAVSTIGKGDIVIGYGVVGFNKNGDPALLLDNVEVLARCSVGLPARFEIAESRFRDRSMDMILNHEQSTKMLRTRAAVVGLLRSTLAARGFMEVETPILWPIAGGASAKPFVTSKFNALNVPLHLRIAPELFLKQLVIGGEERVFEIGKQFRNEEIDPTHNPEFTTLELYQAFGSVKELMELTEYLIREAAIRITGEPTLHTYPRPGLLGHEAPVLTKIDLSEPFDVQYFVPSINRALGVDIEAWIRDDNEKAIADLCFKNNMPKSVSSTMPAMLDWLSSAFVEPTFIKPTFLCNHPIVMSPLARRLPEAPWLSERFELFVGGRELANGYNELNDPEEQRDRFMQQAKARLAGDEEAQVADELYLSSLQLGLPPTVGLGIGIDRLIMMLLGSASIREVLAFPLMRASNKIHIGGKM